MYLKVLLFLSPLGPDTQRVARVGTLFEPRASSRDVRFEKEMIRPFYEYISCPLSHPMFCCLEDRILPLSPQRYALVFGHRDYRSHALRDEFEQVPNEYNSGTTGHASGA